MELGLMRNDRRGGVLPENFPDWGANVVLIMAGILSVRSGPWWL
jgi:hypothetical protein